MTIEPALSHEDEVKCTLQAVDISEAKYESLSYAWGDSAAKSSIHLNGQPFDVTINLAHALRSLRRQGDDISDARILWIDAICIDQGNLLERSQQVQRMGSIYKTANQVIIWLGNYHEPEDETCWGLPYQFDVAAWGFDRVDPATYQEIQSAFQLAEKLHTEFDSKTYTFKPNGAVE